MPASHGVSVRELTGILLALDGEVVHTDADYFRYRIGDDRVHQLAGGRAAVAAVDRRDQPEPNPVVNLRSPQARHNRFHHLPVGQAVTGEVLRVDEVLAVLQIPALDADPNALVGDALEIPRMAGRRVRGSERHQEVGQVVELEQPLRVRRGQLNSLRGRKFQ